MTREQYTGALTRLGLSASAAATFLGVDAKTSYRWINGDSRIPRAAARLLLLMEKLGLKPSDVPEDTP